MKIVLIDGIPEDRGASERRTSLLLHEPGRRCAQIATRRAGPAPAIDTPVQKAFNRSDKGRK